MARGNTIGVGVTLCALAILAAACNVWRSFESPSTFGASTSDADPASSEAGPSDGETSGNSDGDVSSNSDTSRTTPDADITSTCNPDSTDAETIALGSGAAVRETTICRGETKWYSLSPAVGTHLTVSATYSTEQTILSVDLTDSPPPEADAEPIERPVWNDEGVFFDHYVTSPDPHYVRLQFPEDAPGAVDRADASLEFETEFFATRVRWIAPDGPEDGDGSSARPWRDWTTALTSLQPGDLLVATPGTWTSESDCGNRDTPCQSGAEMPVIDCGESEYRDGRAAAPIVVAAEKERRSVIVGDGNEPTLYLDDCPHWQLRGLQLRGRDVEGSSDGRILHVDDASDIRLDRLLLHRPSRFDNEALIEIEDSSEIALVESELYAFHEEGLVVDNSNDVDIARVYLHSRGFDDLDGEGIETSAPDRGDEGIALESAEDVVIRDTVIEDVAVGVEVKAPGAGERNRVDASDGNLFQGVMIRNVDQGFLFDSEAGGCSSPDDPDCAIEENTVRNSVVLDSRSAFRVDGGDQITIEYSTAHDAESKGFSLEPGDSVEDSEGVEQFPPSTDLEVHRSLTFGAGDVGFTVDSNVESWEMTFVNAFGPSEPFRMDDPPSNELEQDPEFGSCRVYIPSSSPMREVDGDRIGAHVVRRHDADQPTDARLWNPLSGAFPCGTVVGNVNAPAPESCRGLHRRFHVATRDCAIP